MLVGKHGSSFLGFLSEEEEEEEEESRERYRKERCVSCLAMSWRTYSDVCPQNRSFVWFPVFAMPGRRCVKKTLGAGKGRSIFVTLFSPPPPPPSSWSTPLFACFGSNDEFFTSDVEVCKFLDLLSFSHSRFGIIILGFFFQSICKQRPRNDAFKRGRQLDSDVFL